MKNSIPSPIFGREEEKEILTQFWESGDSEFLALYGRRRIGKTHLVREFFGKKGIYFEVAGLKKGSMQDQLQIFTEALEKVFYKGRIIQRPVNWHEALKILTKELQKLPSKRKCVVFLDELPWLATPRSKLIQELDYFWNSEWSRLPCKIIVCGSAASWMLENLIYAKGGLHNRLTRTIRLEPLSLKEAGEYLRARKVNLSLSQIVELYMVMGGVPYYLNHVRNGKSTAQIIHELCFRKEGLLYSEFGKIFPALFSNSEKHLRLIRIIAKQRSGVSRMQLIQKARQRSGGTINRPLEELEAAGFIQKYVPYGRAAREHFYRVVDEYTLFYLYWIEGLQKKGAKVNANYWLTMNQKPSWLSWAGYAFEEICRKHAFQIQEAMGISGIACTIGTWRFVPRLGNSERGAQIDLLFDRADGIISLCEIKFGKNPFSISKSYADELGRKMEVFRSRTKTRKALHWVMLAAQGLFSNQYSQENIAGEVTLNDLF